MAMTSMRTRTLPKITMIDTDYSRRLISTVVGCCVIAVSTSMCSSGFGDKLCKWFLRRFDLLCATALGTTSGVFGLGVVCRQSEPSTMVWAANFDVCAAVHILDAGIVINITPDPTGVGDPLLGS